MRLIKSIDDEKELKDGQDIFCIGSNYVHKYEKGYIYFRDGGGLFNASIDCGYYFDDGINIECGECGCKKSLNEEVTFRNGTKHLKATCFDCGSFLKFAQRGSKNPSEFTMPFGKYSGKTLEEIGNIDVNYLGWAGQNLKDGNVKRRINEFLGTKY